jgi:flagellar motility protein MotE (MotC chaperone)
LLLTVKIGDMWTDVSDLAPAVQVADLRAQDSEDEAAVSEEDGEDTESAEGVEDGEEGLGEDELAALDLEALAEESALLDPAPELTQAELDVLQSLRARREALNRRESKLELRESLIEAAEINLESRVEEWKRLKADVEALLAQYEDAEEGKLKTLATYYEKMKPKDAARVFNTLDLPYLIEIVGRMKEAKVADVIGKMDTQKAKVLTVALAQRHEPGNRANGTRSE